MHKTTSAEKSQRIVTVPNIIVTPARPVLAGMAVYHMLRGRPGLATAEAAASAITDFADGKLARWIEGRWPTWGVTELGAKEDQGADTAALAIGGIGMAASNKLHPLARAATVIVLAHEARKAVRASRMITDYRTRTATKDVPSVPSSRIGKWSIGFKQGAEALALATATPGLEKKPAERLGVAAVAFSLAVVGGVTGEIAGIGYDQYYDKHVQPTLPPLPSDVSAPTHNAML